MRLSVFRRSIPSSPGTPYQEPVAVVEMARAEWVDAVQRALAELGLTLADLTEMARKGDFTSIEARKLWVSIGGDVVESDEQADEPADVASELRALTEGIRQALRSAGYFRPSEDLVADVKHMAGEYVRTVADYRALQARYERVTAVGGDREMSRLLQAVDSFSARSGRSESADLARERANNVALSKRLEQERHAKEDLEARIAELQGRAAKPELPPAPGLQVRSPWMPC